MTTEALETFEITWSDEGPLTFYVDPDDGDICIECPDFDFALTITADEWLGVVAFITKQRMRRMS